MQHPTAAYRCAQALAAACLGAPRLRPHGLDNQATQRMPELTPITSCGGPAPRTSADALPCATDVCGECPLAMLRRLGTLKIKAKAPAENDGMIMLPLSDLAPADRAS